MRPSLKNGPTRPFWIAILPAAALLAVSLLGCRGATSTPAPPKKLSPEESFEHIVLDVKQSIGSSSLISAPGMGARSNDMTLQSTRRVVTKELTAPTDENDLYLARIIIKGQTTFASSSMRSDEEPNEEIKQPKKRSPFDPLDPTTAGDEFDPLFSPAELDNPVVSGAEPAADAKDSGPKGQSGTRVVQQFKNAWTEVFDLTYEKGRWVLASEEEDGTLRKGLRSYVESALDRQ